MQRNARKNILIINGNPARERSTFSAALADHYLHHAEMAKHCVTSFKLAELTFDPIQHEGYAKEQPLEPDLLTLRDAMVEADHWVLIFPLWYGLPPALVKGFIERIFVKGFAFEYEGLYPIPLPILKGKTVRVIITCSMPNFVYDWLSGKPTNKALQTLFALCGIKVAGFTIFGSIVETSPAGTSRYHRYFEQLRAIGTKGI